MIYTGIGSRETPDDILQQMILIGDILSMQGYTLRSGGADGADTAFEQGCDMSDGKKEIYLPWKNFNDNPSHFHKITKEAYNLAATIHPVWSNCSFAAKKLHARNCYQVLGFDLKTPTDFVVCWTYLGNTVGGTATAINLAKKNNIPVYNLADDKDYEAFMRKYITEA